MALTALEAVNGRCGASSRLSGETVTIVRDGYKNGYNRANSISKERYKLK
jgi:hypothetical protein